MRKTFIVLLLLLSGCTAGNERGAPGSEPTDPARPTAPDGPGASSELSSNYEFEPYPGSQWYDPDDVPIPEESNVINAITGPEHCGWETGVIIHVGWPLGRDAENISQSRQYLRDPEQVFPRPNLATTFDGDVTLPQTAEATGYRTDFMELWLDPDDDRAAYLVFADHVERWPRAKDVIACA